MRRSRGRFLLCATISKARLLLCISHAHYTGMCQDMPELDEQLQHQALLCRVGSPKHLAWAAAHQIPWAATEGEGAQRRPVTLGWLEGVAFLPTFR